MITPPGIKKTILRYLVAGMVCFPTIMLMPIIHHASGRSTNPAVLLSQSLFALFGSMFLFFGIVDEVWLRWGLLERIPENKIESNRVETEPD